MRDPIELSHSNYDGKLRCETIQTHTFALNFDHFTKSVVFLVTRDISLHICIIVIYSVYECIQCQVFTQVVLSRIDHNVTL